MSHLFRSELVRAKTFVESFTVLNRWIFDYPSHTWSLNLVTLSINQGISQDKNVEGGLSSTKNKPKNVK